MEAWDKNVNVILVDWKGLAFFGQVKRGFCLLKARFYHVF
jgi:hypothetical protein